MSTYQDREVTICFDCKDGHGEFCELPDNCEDYKSEACCFNWGYVTEEEMEEIPEGGERACYPDELALSELRNSDFSGIPGFLIHKIEKARRFKTEFLTEGPRVRKPKPDIDQLDLFTGDLTSSSFRGDFQKRSRGKG